MQCPNCSAVFSYQVDICPHCTYAILQPPPPYQQEQAQVAQVAYQQQVSQTAQTQQLASQPITVQGQQVKASEVAASAAQLASQGVKTLSRTVAGRASIQWVALGAVALMLVCSLGPWFVTSSRYASAASLADGAIAFLGMSGGSFSLAPVYYGFQMPGLANTLANGSTFSNGAEVALDVWLVFILLAMGFVLSLIGLIFALRSKTLRRVPLIVGAAFMIASSGLWSVIYSVDMVGNGVANGTPAPIFCLLAAVASIILVVIAGAKRKKQERATR